VSGETKKAEARDRGALSCPRCDSDNTRTIDVRHEGKSKTVRRHECNICFREFVTVQERGAYSGWVRESQA